MSTVTTLRDRRRALLVAVMVALVGSGIHLGVGVRGATAASPAIAATPTSFGSGQVVTVHGSGFDPGVSVDLWLDANNNNSADTGEAATSITADPSGDFSGATLTVLASPGGYWIRATAPPSATASTRVNVGSCWIQDEGCTINGAEIICLIGDAPSEMISDCKAIDSNYSDPVAFPNGWDFSNVGPRFVGAGVFAAAAVSVNPLVPLSGCGAITNALLVATHAPYNNSVPGQVDIFNPTHSLLTIGCGDVVLPPLDLTLYGTMAAAEALLPGHHGLPDPALDDFVVISGVVGAIQAAAAVAEATIPGTGVTLLFAAQQALAAAAVDGAIACGFVAYWCNGSDITGNIMGHAGLQQDLLPFKFGGNTRWGDIIGWAMPVCHSNVVPPEGEVGECNTPATLPDPGSAGDNNVLAHNKCATGPIIGLSIGYDGDLSFDINDNPDPETGPGPAIADLTNYHNFQPGPGGSEPPNGLDIEIPLADRGLFLPTLVNFRIGTQVKVCGQWVADMHQAWNELHPVTSVEIIDATPPVITPTITGTLGSNGWYTSDVDVSWSVTDAESAISSQLGCGLTTINADTAGTTVSCVATSGGGTATESVTIKRDATKPTISAAAAPPPNGAGWNNTDVTVHFTCADGLSGIPALACPVDQVLTTEGAAVVSTAQTVTDAAGNVSDASNVVTVQIDKTKPTISAAAAPPPNGAGWNNTDVTVHFTCADGLSGIPALACPVDQVLTTEGAAVVSTAQTVTDAADNVSDSSNVLTVNIDKTKPTVAVTGVTDGGQYVIGAVPVAGCQTTDGLSGVATPAGVVVTTSGSNGVGTFIATCSGAVDVAGNPQAAPVQATYAVVYGFGGFLSPLPRSTLTKSGSNIPTKFRLTNASGQPIPSNLAAAMAAAGNVKATLSGPGIVTVSAVCTWSATDLFFQCNLKTPGGIVSGPAYQITAYERLGSTFVVVPAVGSAVNPETVFFK